MRLIGDMPEVDIGRVNATDAVVVGRFIIDSAVSEIRSRSPLGGTWQFGSLAERVLHSDGDIKIVEQMET